MSVSFGGQAVEVANMQAASVSAVPDRAPQPRPKRINDQRTIDELQLIHFNPGPPDVTVEDATATVEDAIAMEDATSVKDGTAATVEDAADVESGFARLCLSHEEPARAVALVQSVALDQAPEIQLKSINKPPAIEELEEEVQLVPSRPDGATEDARQSDDAKQWEPDTFFLTSQSLPEENEQYLFIMSY
jgi:hypothetical protein